MIKKSALGWIAVASEMRSSIANSFSRDRLLLFKGVSLSEKEGEDSSFSAAVRKDMIWLLYIKEHLAPLRMVRGWRDEGMNSF